MKKTLVWFVISAAFIGPGTVTTATSAGAHYGSQLLWTILFAIFACITLQEASARINIASGYSLGEAIQKLFKKDGTNSFISKAVVFSIVLGCAAYEAGNILGAVSGINLTLDTSRSWLTVAIIMIAAILLFTNRFSILTNFLAIIIGVMGLGLLILLFKIDLNLPEVMSGLIIPRIPPGSELITIGLIGTTVVPYNLFLGSRIGQSQEIKTMRRGLVLSVVVGGLISISLVLIGSKITGEFSFDNIAESLAAVVGQWSHYIFAFGLFAAGLTSAITAPWAASITASTTLKVKNKKLTGRVTWIIVLLTGLFFGVSNVKPIPIIILAQALNGIILPFLTIAILFILNNEQLMKAHKNSLIGNISLLFVVWITLILGLLNVLKAGFSAFGVLQPITTTVILWLVLLGLIATVVLGYFISQRS